MVIHEAFHTKAECMCCIKKTDRGSCPDIEVRFMGEVMVSVLGGGDAKVIAVMNLNLGG